MIKKQQFLASISSLVYYVTSRPIHG